MKPATSLTTLFCKYYVYCIGMYVALLNVCSSVMNKNMEMKQTRKCDQIFLTTIAIF